MGESGPTYAEVHSGGNGCITVIILGVLFVIALAIFPAGDHSSTTTTTTTTRTEVNLFSNIKVFSDNQINVASDVNNNQGEGSGTTTTTTTNAPQTTTTTQTGNNSVFSTDSFGNPMCWDKWSAQYTYAACGDYKK